MNPTSWLGMLAVLAPHDASKARLLLLLVPALGLLMLLWWQLQRLAGARLVTTRAAAFIAACWAVPFTLGPVVGSRDAYAYVAQGELARRGLDPTRSVVHELGGGPLLAAVDPRWRDTRPPYGGVAVAIQKVAASADDRPGLSLAVLRLVALVSVLVLVTVTARMATPAVRPSVIVIIAANPLVLVHLVGGAHLDAVAAALLMVGLALGRDPSNARRRWFAIAVCTLGALVKAPVLLGVAYLSLVGLIAAGPALKAKLRSFALDVSAVAAAVVLSIVMSGAGLGWVHNFGTPGRLVTGIAPADVVANLLRAGGWLVGWHPATSSVLGTTRTIAAALGLLLAVVALAPVRRTEHARTRWIAPTRDRLGLALLALGMLGPVLYGWYLAPALPLLALAASRSTHPLPGELARGRAWAIVFALSTVLTFATVPTLAPVWSMLGAHPKTTAGAALVSVLAIAALLWLVRGALRSRTAQLEYDARAEPENHVVLSSPMQAQPYAPVLPGSPR